MPEGLQQASMYYDPFAPEGEKVFDPIAMMADITVKYQNQEVEHDYSADQFVADAEALALDAHVAGLLQEAAMLDQAMHDLCGDDHALQNSVDKSSVFGRKDNNSKHDDHSIHAGHDHGPGGHGHGGSKSESKKKKRRPYEGLLAMLARVTKSNQDFYKQFKLMTVKKS